MNEYKKVLESNVIGQNLIIDEETLFNPDIITNYIDDNGNHYLVGDIISVIIAKSEWNTFLENIRTIFYKKSVLGDKLEIIEKLNTIDFNRTMLFQMAYKHHANDFSNHNQKFLDVRHLHSKINWGVLPLKNL
jgi:hypothetical protein